MLFMAGFLALLWSQAAAGPSSGAPADYTVGPQDVLTIVVFGEPDLSRTVTLDADGSFDFPHVGRINVAGQTARSVAGNLAERLKALYVQPQVSVEVAKFRSRNIFVFGQVHAPGQYPLTANMSVLQALAVAGSPTTAAASYVLISRPAGSEPRLPQDEPGGGSSVRLSMADLQNGRMLPAFSFRDGDTVTVPKAEMVYVTGYVNTPGPYAVDGPLTVMQVVAMAGGATEKGAVNRVKIFRMVDGKLQEVRGVKLADAVRPGDTIEVPQRYF